MAPRGLSQEEIKALKDVARWWTAGKLFVIFATGIVSIGYGVIHFLDFVKEHYK